MVDMLGFISDQLDQLGIPYEFGEWTGEIIEKVPAGTYGIAFWSSQPRNVNGIELRAIRIK